GRRAVAPLDTSLTRRTYWSSRVRHSSQVWTCGSASPSMVARRSPSSSRLHVTRDPPGSSKNALSLEAPTQRGQCSGHTDPQSSGFVLGELAYRLVCQTILQPKHHDSAASWVEAIKALIERSA